MLKCAYNGLNNCLLLHKQFNIVNSPKNTSKDVIIQITVVQFIKYISL